MLSDGVAAKSSTLHGLFFRLAPVQLQSGYHGLSACNLLVPCPVYSYQLSRPAGLVKLGQLHAGHHQLEVQSAAKLLWAPIPAHVSSSQCCKAKVDQEAHAASDPE